MEKELADTIWMDEWKTWFHIYKEWNYFLLYVFNLACDEYLSMRFDSLKWAREHAEWMRERILSWSE